jgi:hypothetical protein
VQQLAARVERSDAQTPSISQPLSDPYRDPGDQHGAERVERYRPPRPPQRAPAIDRAPEIAP